MEVTAHTPATRECLDRLGQYPEVVPDIHPGDPMYGVKAVDPDRNYHRHGQVMLDCIRLGLLAARKPRGRRILDFACGHGRALRYLRAEYPGAQITACDIDRTAVDFCVEKLGAEPLYGTKHPRDLEAVDPFDLIWCGSLLTHVDAPMWVEFLDYFESVLTPGGLLMFSFNGRMIADSLAIEEGDFWIGEDKRQQILKGYERGFGFAEYDEWPDYGVSLSKLSWVFDLLADRSLQVVTFMEARWGAMDVLGLIKAEAINESANPFNFPLGD